MLLSVKRLFLTDSFPSGVPIITCTSEEFLIRFLNIQVLSIKNENSIQGTSGPRYNHDLLICIPISCRPNSFI